MTRIDFIEVLIRIIIPIGQTMRFINVYLLKTGNRQ